MNLWESIYSSTCKYYDSIEEFINIIGDNIIYLQVKDVYCIDEKPSNFYEDNLKDNIVYTDNNHKALIASFILDEYIINSKEYHNFKELIINKKKEAIKKGSFTYIKIDNDLLDDDFFYYLVKYKKNTSYKFESLTNEQIQLLRDNLIDAMIGDKVVSTSKLIGDYSINDLKTFTVFRLTDNDIVNADIKYIKYINNDAMIFFEPTSKSKTYEALYKLGSIKDNLEIKISFDDKIYDYADIMDYMCNLDIIIDYKGYIYNPKKLKEDNNKLNDLIKHINNNLTPTEKYLEVYDIVKQFKEYKENEEDAKQSRNLSNILNNDYIVCVGFSELLCELLKRVGIESTKYSCSVDTSYDSGYSKDNTPTVKNGHSRTLINLKDPKYNIDGIYVSDATWDNFLDKNFYNHALMTFDSMQKSKRMFYLNIIDYFFDNHNFNEYNEKINNLLTRNERSKALYDNIYNKVLCHYLEIIKKLDSKEYNLFLKKYNINFDNYYIKKDFKNEEYIQMFTDIGNYILSKTNKGIPFDKILEIANNKNEKLKKTKIDKTTYELNLDRQNKLFPYEVDDKKVWIKKK